MELQTAESSKACTYLKVCAQLRAAIEAGEFPPGCRMPTVGELAKRYKTSAFTIQSALKPLERDGLIEQKRRVGIFVRNAKARLQTLGIYYGRDIWAMEELEYYRRMHNAFSTRLRKLGLASKLFIDDRPDEDSAVPFPPLAKAIAQGEIQAAVAMIVNWNRIQWFHELELPKAFFGSAGFPGRVANDLRSLVGESCKALKALGRRKLAVIASERFIREPFMEIAAAQGFELREEWTVIGPDEDLTGRLQSFGYEGFLKIWRCAEKPDALLINPDSACRGVVTAMLSKGVKCPEELLVATHFNKGIDFPCPFPMLKARVDQEEMVDALMEQLRVAMQGLPQGLTSVPFKIIADPGIAGGATP